MNYQPIIESKYNRENWMNLLFDIFKSNVEIWSSPILTIINNDIAKQTFILGKITLTDGHKLGIYEIQLNDNIQIERNKVSIRNLLVTDWHNKGMDGAFMFCYKTNESVLRFSYVSESWSLGEDSQIETNSTDTRRFTYYLGEGHRCRTAIQQFEILRESSLTLQDVTAAFNVDTLSKAFFDGYKKLYEDIVAFVTGKRMVKEKNKWIEKLTEDGPNQEMMIQFAIFDNPEKTVRDYIKKLLGRLVFLQFIQKKGWLGVRVGNDWGTGDREYLQHLFDNTDLQATFIDDVLEPLFYFINNEHNDEDTTKCKILGVGIRVPYLNGGLFERDKEDDAKFNLPIKYLKEIFEFFSQYNFTIDENDPDDAEIGVDPEMLGRIFENLLEDNKDKGAFYTPKEIVQYMCKESLISYLQIDKSEIDKEIIRIFVSEHDAQNLSDRLKSELEKKLEHVKICDPAIGSGAFPMGLLRELLYCRHAINDKQNIYALKKNIIENNIYGVDIEKGAIDIARLRFWLSIIVDSDKPEPLPNFDYKFMQGNSLLECYNGVDLSTLTRKKKSLQTSFLEDTRDTLRLQLKSYLKHYYNEADHQKKKELKQKIAGNIDAQMKEAGYNLDFTNLDVSANNHFFLWHTWFSDVFDKDHDGFDIVIGNPPYMRVQDLRATNSKFVDYLTKKYVSAVGSFDLYAVFVEKSMDLLLENGTQCFIMPTKWTNADFGKGLRSLLLGKVDRIIDFSSYQVFEASTYTGIQFFKKESDVISYVIVKEGIKTNKELGTWLRNLKFKDYTHINANTLSSGKWILTTSNIQEILEKINKQPKRLNDVFEKIFQGLATSKDDVYFLYKCRNKEKTIVGYSKQLEKDIEIEKGILKPLLKGEDVHRYEVLHTDRNVIFPYKIINNSAVLYTEEEISQLFPRGYAYLKECEPILREREKGRFNIDNLWFQFGRKQGIHYERIPKLLAPEISLGGNFTYDSNGEYYSTTTIYGYIKRENIKISYECLSTILNSQILWWYIVNTGTTLANGYFRYKPAYLNLFPFPIINSHEDKKLSCLFNSIIKARRAGHDVKQIECEINAIIYNLYNLDEKEIRIIESINH